MTGSMPHAIGMPECGLGWVRRVGKQKVQPAVARKGGARWAGLVGDGGGGGCPYLVSENFMVMPKSWVTVG